jgi:hypothetical protein
MRRDQAFKLNKFIGPIGAIWHYKFHCHLICRVERDVLEWAKKRMQELLGTSFPPSKLVIWAVSFHSIMIF